MKKIVMTLVIALLVATLSISVFAADAKDSPVLDGGKDPSGSGSGAVESPDTGIGVAAALAGLGVLDTALIGAYLAGKNDEE